MAKKFDKKICYFCAPKYGPVAEWLGRALQKLLQRFESARDLTNTKPATIAGLYLHRIQNVFMEIIIRPVAKVINSRKEIMDDNWSDIISEIELLDDIPADSFTGIEAFSHLEIIFYFDKIDASKMSFASHPRGNTKYPFTGIFAQRKKDRPNAIGLTTVELLSHNGKKLMVKNLDAINGTPIIDIKPVLKEFMPQGNIRQPEWTHHLMKKYW